MAADLRGRRVVVTGGAGFIGVHSVEALVDAGAAVLVVDDLRHASYRALPSSARLEVADVAEAPARAAIEGWKPDAVLHLAAQGGVNRSWREPAADAHINVLGSVSVLTAAIACGCRRVVVASSGGALYGAARRLPTPEDEPSQPRSPYGTAKLCIEHYLGHFTRAGAIDALALRYGNVYGPGQDGTGEAGVVAISSYRLLAGQAPVIRGDGSQTRDFTYVGDIVAANLSRSARR
jgi:UDP-glucose 4-epimerase